MSETKTETVVVDDANAAHKLIGRTSGGVAIDHWVIGSGGATARDVDGQWLDSTVYGDPAGVEVDALPPATMWVRLDQVIGQTIPGHNIEVRRVNYRRNPDGWIWHGYEPHAGSHLHLDDDGMVEVLAPVPEVEAADEVSGAMEHLSALVGSMHEAQHEYLFNDSPEDKHAASALGEFHGPLMRAVEQVAAALAADRGEA